MLFAKSSLEHFFTEFDAGTEGDEQRSKKVQWVCSDMWKPHLNVIERVCTQVKNILDRFHIKGHLTNAVNETRKMDVRQLQSGGRESVLSCDAQPDRTDEEVCEYIAWSSRVVAKLVQFQGHVEWRGVAWRRVLTTR